MRVTIETIEESTKEIKKKPDEVGLRFLEEMEGLPAANDLPEDLAHQHDHYLYGLPKKS